ncbi:MAG: hypothetical protein KDJ27_03185 [Gammaproteobacteria bacterium]|nr:hypothetical protein [Gammaproteobacteria bacterium]
MIIVTADEDDPRHDHRAATRRRHRRGTTTVVSALSTSTNATIRAACMNACSLGRVRNGETLTQVAEHHSGIPRRTGL